jgi:hypothetical protein
MFYMKKLLFILSIVALSSGCKQEGHQIIPVPTLMDSGSILLNANDGNLESQFKLGSMYFHGVGLDKNIPEAKEWFAKSAYLGDSKSQLALGQMFLSGDGLPINRVQAYIWISLSKAGGHENADILLETVMEQMTEQEIIEAQKLSKDKYDEIQNNIKYQKNNEEMPNSEPVITTTKIQVPKVVSSSSSSSLESSIIIKSISHACTRNDWDCTPWSECDDSLQQNRDCILVNHECTKPLSVKPSSTRSPTECIDNLINKQSEEKIVSQSVFDRWDSIHQEMVKLARDYVDQNVQHSTYNTLVILEGQFILRYNEYVRIYNDRQASGRNEIMTTLENKIEEIIKEYNSLPKVIY